MKKQTFIKKVEKQRLVKRLLSAVLKKSFAWLSQYPVGVGTPETMMFLNYTGVFGLEEAITYQSLSRFKEDKGN